MKGCLYKKEKSKLHSILKEPPDKTKGLTLDYGLADMVSVLYPHYAVVDGTICMEGFGPGLGTSKKMDMVLASKSPLAADLVAVRLMGMDRNDVKHLNLIADKFNEFKIENIAVNPENYMALSQSFELPSTEKLKAAYPNANVVEKGSCSACTNTILAFLLTHGNKLPKSFNYTLAAGSNLSEDDLNSENVFLIGSCSAYFRDKLPLCKGCPPVGSSILTLINEYIEGDIKDIY